MTRDIFLTQRWNNYISLGLVLVFLTYIVAVVAAAIWGEQPGFIGLVLIGVVF